METRRSRLHSSSSSLSRSRSPLSDNEKRSISNSPRQGPSTPIKTSRQRNDSNDKQDPNDREFLTFNENSKAIINETSSPMMSDIEENHQKKRSHHKHRHRHHKQSKSNKHSIIHHRHSVKRRYLIYLNFRFYSIINFSKKETVSTTHQQKSDDENSLNSPTEKNTSETEQQNLSSSDNQSNDDDEEEGIVEGNSTPSERRSHHRHKKQRRSSSSNTEQNSPNVQSSSISIPKNNKGTQLIVNYLPASLRESDFYQLFARIAPVKLCKLIIDRHTGHSYCYGFIEYHTKEDAIKAIEKFNGYRIEHKKLKVSYAQPKSNNNNNDDDDEIDNQIKHIDSSSIQKNSNIYITDLPDDFDEKMLERLFSKYGEIAQTKVLRDPRTKISRGVAFVLMSSTRYAERAVKALDGYVPPGSHTPISVKYADPKKTTNNESNNSLSRLSRASSMVSSIGSYGYPPGLPPFNMIDPYYAAALHHHHRAAMNMFVKLYFI
jgi:RNA recognition motif-containing protein